MNAELYTATGTKKGSLELPASLFGATINKGLMHLALIRQLSNRRAPIAHVKTRGEIVGTTKKAYQQKHTGNARRGALRSPLVRGGGKTFGPRNTANFVKDMPKKMRRAALFSCLSLRASEGAIIGLENYPEDSTKTKALHDLLQKLPVDLGRHIVIVLAGRHRGLELSARNIHRVKTLFAQYLNPEDILRAQKVIFLADAIPAAENLFCKEDGRLEKKSKKQEAKDAAALEKKTKPKAEAAIKAVKKPAIRKSKIAKKTPSKAS